MHNNHSEKFFLLFFICISITFLSTAQTSYKDSIVYENIGSCLILYDDNTFVFKNKGVDISRIQEIGDDIITYGRYVQYEKKSIFLYSHPDIQTSQMQIITKEFVVDGQDSIITIILSSPFSTQKKENPNLLKDTYFYFIEMLFAGEENNKYSQISFSDTILIQNVNRHPLKEISIRIYPYKPLSHGTPYYSYLFLDYTLNSIFSNLLYINIPTFTAYYLNYDRFYGKEVEIIDSCTIGIDKKFLLSKCKGEHFNEEWEFIIHQLRNPYEFDEWGNEIDE